MVKLTCEDLAAITSALFLATKEAPQTYFRTYIHAWIRVERALQEAKNIEPKPKYKLTREGE